MKILNYYYAQKEKNIFPNQEQLNVLQKLQNIQDKLILERKKRLRYPLLRKKQLVKGMYLHGGVGIGKTFLMDCFYHSLPFKSKKRIHFFEFMQFIHLELKKYEGEKNPLVRISKEMAKDTLVICLDEFFVKDIVDAILMAQLLKALFREGITLIITSNIPPSRLYERGLQRKQFLPAIQLLNTETEIVHLSCEEDYRLRYIHSSEIYFYPHDEQKMENIFQQLRSGQIIHHPLIEIAGRKIKAKMQAQNCIWFEFQEICQIPRSQIDYLSIAKQYPFVFISNIPAIAANEKNIIRLFVSLIDVLYDARTKIIFSSSVSIANIYQMGDMIFEFARTQSRLQEMQTETYFQSQIKNLSAE